MNITSFLLGILMLVFMPFADGYISTHMFFALGNLWMMLAVYLTHIKCK